MKILPRKIDIDKAKAQERKKEIDEGLAIAKRVDALRETKAQEEKALRDFRDNSIKAVQQEIDSYIEVRDNLKIQTEVAEAYRRSLLEPLNKEWAELNTEKAFLEVSKKEIYLAGENLKLETQDIEDLKVRAAQALKIAIQKKREAKQIKHEIVQLKKAAESEHNLKQTDREAQQKVHEKGMSELHKAKETYENGLAVIELERKGIQDKEAELIIRENRLKTQQIAMQIAAKALKNNGYSMSTDH